MGKSLASRLSLFAALGIIRLAAVVAMVMASPLILLIAVVDLIKGA